MVGVGILAAAITAANAQTRVDLKPSQAVGVQQLDGGRSFPVATVVVGIGIDAGRGIEQIRQFSRDGY